MLLEEHVPAGTQLSCQGEKGTQNKQMPLDAKSKTGTSTKIHLSVVLVPLPWGCSTMLVAELTPCDTHWGKRKSLA